MDNKKGFGEVASTLIMFIAVIGITAAVVVAMSGYVSDTGDAVEVQHDLMNNQLRTALDIGSVYYQDGELGVYVKNVGSTRLDVEDFSIFMSENFYMGSDFDVVSASGGGEVDLLQPGETVLFKKNTSLEERTYEVRVVSGFGGQGAKFYFNN